MGLDQDSDSFLSLNGEVCFLIGGSRHFRVSKKDKTCRPVSFSA